METKNSENHSNDCAVEVEKKVVKRKRSESQYLKVRNRARNIFRNQIDKSVETKRLAISRSFVKYANSDYTFDRFLAELNEGVEMLLDSRRFEEACKTNNLVPFNVATHIAFDGIGKIQLVLKNGLKANYYTQLTEFKRPLFSENELKCATDPDCDGCPPKEEPLSQKKSSSEEEDSSAE